MATEHIDVSYVADLARIDLAPEEIVHFQEQLERILGFIETLKDADVSGVELGTSLRLPLEQTRADRAADGISPAAFLKNAPDQAAGQLRVPKVVDA
jgi:aspartyl-tRNA(Asn)/glutamyl-tRNA(Gln) amidotransferase subunit C